MYSVSREVGQTLSDPQFSQFIASSSLHPISDQSLIQPLSPSGCKRNPPTPTVCLQIPGAHYLGPWGPECHPLLPRHMVSTCLSSNPPGDLTTSPTLLDHFWGTPAPYRFSFGWDIPQPNRECWDMLLFIHCMVNTHTVRLP